MAQIVWNGEIYDPASGRTPYYRLVSSYNKMVIEEKAGTDAMGDPQWHEVGDSDVRETVFQKALRHYLSVNEAQARRIESLAKDVMQRAEEEHVGP